MLASAVPELIAWVLDGISRAIAVEADARQAAGPARSSAADEDREQTDRAGTAQLAHNRR
jgi:hypothetical protein